jgi:hypothetical protein
MPHLLYLLPAKKWLLAPVALCLPYHVILAQIVETFALRAAATLGLFINWGIDIHEDQAVVQFFTHPCRVERLVTARTLPPFIRVTAVVRPAHLIFDRGKAESHEAKPSWANSGK